MHDLYRLFDTRRVGLVLDEDYGPLFTDFSSTASEVAVEFVLEKAVHAVAAVLLLHDHEGRVFGESFREHVGAFDTGSDELVGPPLMA